MLNAWFVIVFLVGVHNVNSPLDTANLARRSDKTNGLVDSVTDGKDAFEYHPRSYDTAYLYINNEIHEGIHVWGQSNECYGCKLMYLSDVQQMTEKLFFMDTRWKLKIVIKDTNGNVTYCNGSFHFGELGNYTLYISKNNATWSDDDTTANLELITNEHPQDSNLPIYVAIAAYAVVAMFYILIKAGLREGWFRYILYCFTASDQLITNELGAPSPDTTTLVTPISDRSSINRHVQGKPRRLKSLDTFRGIIIVTMIFVNYGGGNYWFFKHAGWNGLTVADLVFPWFVFIMGVSMTLSFHGMVIHKIPRKSIFYKIIKRTIILFSLGCIISNGNSLPNYRIPGILQRLSASFLIIASIQLISAKPERHTPRIMNKYYALFHDILDYWYEWIIIAALVLVYSCLTRLLNVPGCPTGYLGPGGPLVGTNGELTNCTGGAAAYIDKWILGEKHLYQHPSAKIIYKTTQPHDSNGILGTITSIILTFFGLQAGKILLLHQRHDERLKRLLIWGAVLGGLGTLLCKASKEGGWVPINKNLWSMSYILVMSGTGFILLSVCYFTIDVKRWWSGVPFYYPGMNSILLYAGHELLTDRYAGHEILNDRFPFSWEPYYKTHAEYLAMNLIGVSLWVTISYWMFCIDFFVKI